MPISPQKLHALKFPPNTVRIFLPDHHRFADHWGSQGKPFRVSSLHQPPDGLIPFVNR